VALCSGASVFVLMPEVFEFQSRPPAIFHQLVCDIERRLVEAQCLEKPQDIIQRERDR
jgi:hypothetical protein